MSNLRLSELKSSGIVNVNDPSIGGLSVKYGDFGQADPELTKRLPTSVNLGLTSPGFLDNASECKGVDFIDQNPPYDKITFAQCLNKFQDQYFIPEQGFASLLKNLPLTFSALDDNSKKFYINELQKFLNTVDPKNNVNNSKPIVKNNKEKFGNTESNETNKTEINDCKKLANIDINCYLIIIIIILIGIIGYGVYKNQK
tara:strand:- start:267 stop:866 length:600 start_codon:yes stop_codon:yes gene_type:complete